MAHDLHRRMSGALNERIVLIKVPLVLRIRLLSEPVLLRDIHDEVLRQEGVRIGKDLAIRLEILSNAVVLVEVPAELELLLDALALLGFGRLGVVVVVEGRHGVSEDIGALRHSVHVLVPVHALEGRPPGASVLLVVHSNCLKVIIQ